MIINVDAGANRHAIDPRIYVGAANAGGVRYYAYDNEPVLWSFDHWDVHPNGSTYDEVWGKWSDYGPAIKAKDSSALLLGPEEWGWDGYFDDGNDAENGNSADRDAKGGTYFAEWLLQQAKAYEQAHLTRILDVFTLHFYPQSGEFSNNVSAAMQAFETARPARSGTRTTLMSRGSARPASTAGTCVSSRG